MKKRLNLARFIFYRTFGKNYIYKRFGPHYLVLPRNYSEHKFFLDQL